MKQIFESATLRATGWYLLILACISLLFSVIIYQVSISEVERRLTHYQDQSWIVIDPTSTKNSLLDKVRQSELANSKATIVGILIYVNLIVLTVGGILSYILARRTLRPIERAHEAQTRFVSDASHELRTPLATIIMELEVASSDTSLTKPELRELLTSNLEEARRLNTLSTTLLALSTGREDELTKRAFDITTLIQNTVTRITKSHRRDVRLSGAKSHLRVIGHQSSIEELLNVLLENAVKYSPSQSTIDVEIVASEQSATIAVINQGNPIPPEHLPHIFERFYRVDSSRSVSQGYGLGLALAKQISDFHTAQLAVKSTADATCFSFILPLVRQKNKK
jgi:signal transduction histidine kinase